MPHCAPHRVLVVVAMLGLVAPGCTAMRGPSTASSPGDVDDESWLAGTRRRLAQAAREINADLDFHENEGLDAFAPDAVDQVNMLRGDMNGSSGISR